VCSEKDTPGKRMVDLTNDEGNRREMPSLIGRAQWPRKRHGNDETIQITWLVLKRPSVAGFEAPNDTNASTTSRLVIVASMAQPDDRAAEEVFNHREVKPAILSRIVEDVKLTVTLPLALTSAASAGFTAGDADDSMVTSTGFPAAPGSGQCGSSDYRDH